MAKPVRQWVQKQQPSPGGKQGHGSNWQGLTADGSTYTAEELEFMQAMQEWMKANKVKFPKFTDVLHVAKSLGYRKGDT